MTYQPANAMSAFVPTTEVYSDDQVQMRNTLTSTHSTIANAVNVREIALYEDGQAILTGQQFSIPGDSTQKRYSFRKMFYFGAIASGATLNIPHGITDLVEFTHIYGTCKTAIPDYRPIPYVSMANIGFQIDIKVNGTNIIIINGIGGAAVAITSGIIVVEYLLD